MINIYSKQGLTRVLKEVEKGCDCTMRIFRGCYKPMYMRFVFNGKYDVNLKQTEFGGNIIFKENLSLGEVLKMINELVFSK